jgi:hypothetical protein
MQAACFPARQPRTHYRHELRTLTYVTLDEANGGILRNLSHQGAAIQAVGALRKEQRVRLRFELRFPRLRVDVCGQVSWASSSGQCGVRFLDLSDRASCQIDEWIFSNLLDSLAHEAAHPRSIFGAPVVSIAPEENDGLVVSAPPRPAIWLEPAVAVPERTRMLDHREEMYESAAYEPDAQQSWLSRPVSPRALAWMVDSLVVIAGLLMFVLTFLSIAHELPRLPLALSMALAAAAFVAVTYRALFAFLGGPSVGTRLAQAAPGIDEKQEEDGAGRFR